MFHSWRNVPSYLRARVRFRVPLVSSSLATSAGGDSSLPKGNWPVQSGGLLLVLSHWSLADKAGGHFQGLNFCRGGIASLISLGARLFSVCYLGECMSFWKLNVRD